MKDKTKLQAELEQLKGSGEKTAELSGDQKRSAALNAELTCVSEERVRLQRIVEVNGRGRALL